MSTSKPLIARVDSHECYFWINDEKELCVAMRATHRSLLGRRFHRDFLLSLVLGDPPASIGRSYRVSRRTLRTRLDRGYTHTRSASLGGIVGVWNYGRSALKGRFRITSLRQSYWVLTGWRNREQVLILGDFTAIRNRVKGEAIVAETEEQSMKRPPRRKRRTRKAPAAAPDKPNP